MKKDYKMKILMGTFLSFIASASAQGIGSASRFDPGSWLDSIFRLDQGTMILIADIGVFFLVWFGFYAVLAVVVKYFAKRVGGKAEKIIMETFLGEGGGSSRHHRDTSSYNWFFWISGLALLGLGPYLFPYIHNIQRALIGGSIIGLGALIVVAGGALVLILMTVLGEGGKIFGNEVAPRAEDGYDSTKDVLGEAYERGSNWVQNRRNSPLGNWLGSNNQIQKAGDLLDNALASTGLHKCSNCGTWNRGSNDPNQGGSGCLNCDNW